MFAVMVVCTYLCIKGAAGSMAELAMLPLFKEMGGGGTVYARMRLVALLPWSMKPIFGLVADRWRSKRCWFLASAVLLGVAASAYVAGHTANTTHVVMAATGVSFMVAVAV